MPFDPTVYIEPSIDPISDDEWDSDYDSLFDFQIRHDIELAGMMDEDVFVNRLTLIDELEIVLCRRSRGVQILLPPTRG